MFVDEFSLPGFPDEGVLGAHFLKWGKSHVLLTVTWGIPEMTSNRKICVPVTVKVHCVEMAHKPFLSPLLALTKIRNLLALVSHTIQFLKDVFGLAIHYFSRMLERNTFFDFTRS